MAGLLFPWDVCELARESCDLRVAVVGMVVSLHGGVGMRRRRRVFSLFDRSSRFARTLHTLNTHAFLACHPPTRTVARNAQGVGLGPWSPSPHTYYLPTCPTYPTYLTHPYCGAKCTRSRASTMESTPPDRETARAAGAGAGDDSWLLFGV